MRNLKNLKRDVEIENIYLERKNEMIELFDELLKAGVNTSYFKNDGNLMKKYEHFKNLVAQKDRNKKIKIDGLEYHVQLFGTYIRAGREIELRSRICVSGGEKDINNVSQYCNYFDINLYETWEREKSEPIKYGELKRAILKKIKIKKQLEEVESPFLHNFSRYYK